MHSETAAIDYVDVTAVVDVDVRGPQARQLADSARRDSEQGIARMEDMLSSMSEIQESSQEIAKLLGKPDNTGPESLATIMASTAFGFVPSGTSSWPSTVADVAHTPTSTQGAHTSMMKIGCTTTGSLKLSALFAVSQC